MGIADAVVAVFGLVDDEIGGAGGLIKMGAQPLSLAASNSYAGATTVKAGGVLRITHGYALGSTNGTTTAEDGSIIEVYGGITIPESFALYGDASTGYGGVMRIKGGSNVISGVILNGSRIKTNSGSLDLIGGATPRAIRQHLGLNKPIYARTTAYGHFGREPDADGGFSWEKTDLVDQLKALA